MTRETHGRGEAGGPREVRVHVLFFGAAREAATDEAVLTLAPGATARDGARGLRASVRTIPRP